MKNKKVLNITLPIYYGLIIIPIILFLTSAIVDLWFYGEELLYLDRIFWIEPKQWEWMTYIIAIAVLLTALIGILLRAEWGRKLFLYSYFLSYLLYFLPSMQWVYMSKLASLFYDAANIFLGMLLLVLLMPSLYQPIFAKKDKR